MSDVYEYQKINISTEPSPDPHGLRKATVESVANRWAEDGWRTVSVMPSIGPGYADAILVERKKIPIAIQVPYQGEILTFPWSDVTRFYLDADKDSHG